MYRSFSLWELQCVRVAVWASCGVGELWCVAAMVWGSCIVGKLQCAGVKMVTKALLIAFLAFFNFLRFFHLRKKIDKLKNPHWPNCLTWLIFQGIWNRQGC